ncbi:MAG: addiction module protein [Burkholderiales bacterium]
MEEARRLSVAERIELVADIWDSVAEVSQLPVSEAQRDELRRRLEYYDSHPEERGVTLAEIKAKLGVRT